MVCSELMLLPRDDGQGNLGDKLELISDLVLLPSDEQEFSPRGTRGIYSLL